MRSITIKRSRARAAALALAAATVLPVVSGCAPKPAKYGVEHTLLFPGRKGQVWAIAPAVNLSGQREVDPLLQADLLYIQLQAVRGLTVVPVNRVAEVYAALRIDTVASAEQAAAVCEQLGADALVVPTVTAYDAYDPPKFGSSVQVFRRPDAAAARVVNVDPRDLARAAAPIEPEVMAAPDPGFVQAVGMYDAANGTVREALKGYAHGRHDPAGPMGNREYLQSMDRYVGFAYHLLIEDLLRKMRTADGGAAAAGGDPKQATDLADVSE